MVYQLELYQQLLIVLAAAILSMVVGRTAKVVTRSRIPGKEILTYLWYGWIIVTFIVYVFTPEYFFVSPYVDVGVDLFLVTMLAMFVAYPIGYHFGFIYIVYFTEIIYDEHGVQEAILTEPYVYYYRKFKNGTVQLCIQEQGVWETTKTLFGIHNTATIPFDKIRRTYNVSTRSKYLRARAPRSASCRKHERNPYTIKKWFFTWNVCHHNFIIGEHTSLDPIEFLITMSKVKDATALVESLSAQVAGLQIERGQEALKGGAQIVKNLRGLRLDDDIREKIFLDIKAEEDRRKKMQKEDELARLATINAAKIVTDNPPKDPKEEEEI